jgi:hypothetical protein
MLFNYRYVNHSIEKLQVYLDHLVKEVWCKANGPFSVNILHPDLQAIVKEIADDESITKDHLDGPIRRIYEIFRTQLSAAQRDQVARCYDHNNNIEALCSCHPGSSPATYVDIRAISADLAIALKDFCRSLFTDIIHLKAVVSRIGDIDSHYEAFVTENKEGKCPYCGYGDIKGLHHTRREAYDHYLPKGAYPFNSVNFRNLAPMCNECNSTYKLAKDPTRNIDPITCKTGSTRRKAFYSFATAASGITINLILKTQDVSKLHPNDIEVQITAPGRDEEVEAWNDVFSIKERYRAKLCGQNEGKAWLVQIIDEAANVSMTPGEMLAAKRKTAAAQPYVDANFLKMAFLTACQTASIFEAK